jgi:protein phosphatase/serine/threonine-protein phosphatase Stp1
MSWATTHVGTVRSLNEDALVDRPDLGLWAVADGAGGHARGDLAANAVVEALESIPPDLSAADVLAQVRQKMAETHAALLLNQDGATPEISASTVVVLIARGEHYACLWAGDSRCYLLRDQQLLQITRDHSLVQELVDTGAISPEDADSHPNANVITRAIGSQEDLDLDKVSNRLMPGDRFLLCSDGLCKTLTDADIAALLASSEPTLQLIEAALANQGRDNITAVAIEVLGANDEVLCDQSPGP